MNLDICKHCAGKQWNIFITLDKEEDTILMAVTGQNSIGTCIFSIQEKSNVQKIHNIIKAKNGLLVNVCGNETYWIRNDREFEKTKDCFAYFQYDSRTKNDFFCPFYVEHLVSELNQKQKN